MVDLKVWLIGGPSTKGFSDLHIDDFDSRWRERSRWIEGGLSVLEAAVGFSGVLQNSCKLGLLFPLRDLSKAEPPEFSTMEELQSQLDMNTPPSIFMADSLSEPWVNSRAYENVLVEKIPKEIVTAVFATPFPCDALFMHYSPDDDDEVRRSVWLVPATK